MYCEGDSSDMFTGSSENVVWIMKVLSFQSGPNDYKMPNCAVRKGKNTDDADNPS